MSFLYFRELCEKTKKHFITKKKENGAEGLKKYYGLMFESTEQMSEVVRYVEVDFERKTFRNRDYWSQYYDNTAMMAGPRSSIIKEVEKTTWQCYSLVQHNVGKNSKNAVPVECKDRSSETHQ